MFDHLNVFIIHYITTALPCLGPLAPRGAVGARQDRLPQQLSPVSDCISTLCASVFVFFFLFFFFYLFFIFFFFFLFFYSPPLSCLAASVNTILLQPVLPWNSSYVPPPPPDSSHVSIHPCFSLHPRRRHLQWLSSDVVLANGIGTASPHFHASPV